MASEKCKLCGDLATPWSWIKELKGHICMYCSFVLPVIENCFNKYMISLAEEKDMDGEYIQLNKKAKQKITKYFTEKWGS